MEATECPRCEALHKFPRLTRPHAELRGVKEVYIKCPTCRYVQIIGPTTDAIEQTRKRIARLQRKAQDERNRYGEITESTANAQHRQGKRLAKLYGELWERVKEEKRGGTEEAD